MGRKASRDRPQFQNTGPTTNVVCVRCSARLAELWSPDPPSRWDGIFYATYQRSRSYPGRWDIDCQRCTHHYVVTDDYMAQLVRAGLRRVVLGQPIPGRDGSRAW
jgi:hypothetical protein